MTFEQYKKGLIEVIKQAKYKEIEIKRYNSKVSKECNFYVNIGDLMDKIVMVSNVENMEVEVSTQLSPWFIKDKKAMAGIAKIDIIYDSSDLSKPVASELARFPLYSNTKFIDGSTLRENTYVQKDFGRIRLKMLPGTKVQDLIVKVDLNNEYMIYPDFLKALLKCKVIEVHQEELNK